MSANNQLVLSYLNSAVTEAEIENAKKYNLDLCIIKFEIKESDSKKYKDILKFIDSYFDFASIVPDNSSSYMMFIRNVRLHATVLMVKNLNLALKINFSTKLKSVAVTNLDIEDDINSVIERLNKYYMKAKITGSDIYYGTRNLDFNDRSTKIISNILSNNKELSMYGLFQEAPIKIDAYVLTVDDNHAVFSVPKEFISFLNKQPILYFEHSDIPDLFTASVLKGNFENSTIEVGEFKFVDHSPLHRKNLRVAPISPVKATLGVDDFVISGFISDISVTSILLTTELNNIDELQKNKLIDKTFKLMFDLELFGNIFEVSMKVTIFRITGNQLILNIFADSDTQKIITEYINMCYQQLLLQVQGKVV